MIFIDLLSIHVLSDVMTWNLTLSLENSRHFTHFGVSRPNRKFDIDGHWPVFDETLREETRRRSPNRVFFINKSIKNENHV